MRILLILLFCLPNAALALEYCDELWFSRNMVFHKAGHCFGSPLGKAVFGNEGCRADGIALTETDRTLIARFKAAETEEGCKIDTSRTSVPVILPAERKALVDMPFPSLYESACIGWRGDRVELRNAAEDIGAVVGAIRKGDTLLFQFEDQDDWSFVEITQNGVTAGMGWAKLKIDAETCDALAG